MLRENEKNCNTKEKKFHRKKTKNLDRGTKEFVLINKKKLYILKLEEKRKSNDTSVEEIGFLSFLRTS